MPNWVWQYIELSGNPETVTKFMNALKAHEHEGNVSILDTFMPCPVELQAITSGVTTLEVDGVKTRVEEWHDIGGKPVPLSNDERVSLLQRFGAVDWYEWCVKNWGCKWADHSQIVKEGDETIIKAETPWSSPEIGFKSIAKLFPDMYWKVIWAEEGNDGGYYYIDSDDEESDN